jgi:hypothetical protein
MAALSDDTRIMTKHKCPDCLEGKIPRDNPDDYIFDSSYCPTCEGMGWIQQWTTLTELCRAVNRINSMLSCAK